MTRDATRTRAVVIGGSMAGLLAARVLADVYGEVTVIDRDRLPQSPEHRRGVPQAHHAHALLARGQQVLEELFPGITAELAARGAPTGDMLHDAHLHFSGHRSGKPRVDWCSERYPYSARGRGAAAPGRWRVAPTWLFPAFRGACRGRNV